MQQQIKKLKKHLARLADLFEQTPTPLLLALQCVQKLSAFALGDRTARSDFHSNPSVLLKTQRSDEDDVNQLVEKYQESIETLRQQSISFARIIDRQAREKRKYDLQTFQFEGPNRDTSRPTKELRPDSKGNFVRPKTNFGREKAKDAIRVQTNSSRGGKTRSRKGREQPQDGRVHISRLKLSGQMRQTQRSNSRRNLEVLDRQIFQIAHKLKDFI